MLSGQLVWFLRNVSRKRRNACERYVNDKGDKVDWQKRQPGEKGEKDKDHWHWIPGGIKKKNHCYPGETVKKVAIGAAVAGAAAVVIHAIIERAPYWVPALAL